MLLLKYGILGVDNMNLDNLLDKLKMNGYKITVQRKAILRALAENHNNLITVENLFEKSKEIYPKTNMSTVYRNLEILEKLKLVYKVLTENGMALYKLVCSDKHHHHIICKKCGKTEVIDFCPIDNLKQIIKNKKFILTDHKLELYGYCLDCKNSEDS